MMLSKILERTSLAELPASTQPSTKSLPPTRTETPTERLTSAKDSAKSLFESKAKTLGAVLPSSAKEHYQKAVQDRWMYLQEKIFTPLESRLNKSDFSQMLGNAISKATKEIDAALQRLNIDADRSVLLANRKEASTLPQLTKNEKGDINLIRKAPPIENLVLRGGGAKGISYGAALEQYQLSAYLDDLKRIAGSSAGALTATCLACGVSASQFDNIESEQLFKSAASTYLKDIKNVYPDLTFAESKGILTGLSAVRTVDTAIAEQVHRFLAQHFATPTFQTRLFTLVDAHIDNPGFAADLTERLLRLMEKPDVEQSRQGKMITFRDLSLLHQLAPDTFKELTLTAWDPANKCTVYFDKDKTPDIPVCYAARSSMSYPVAFKPVAMDLGDGQGKRTLIDGGVGSNLPVEAFESTSPHPIDKEINAAKTLMFVFDMNGLAYQVMTSGGVATTALQEAREEAMKTQRNSVIAKVCHWFLGKDPRDTRFEDQEKLWNAGPNAVPVFHGTISSTSANVHTSRAHAARLQAATEALAQIRQRESQAYFISCRTLDEAARQLSEAEKKALGALPRQPTSGDLQRAADKAKAAEQKCEQEAKREAERVAEQTTSGQTVREARAALQIADAALKAAKAARIAAEGELLLRQLADHLGQPVNSTLQDARV
jgi:predicted acylesterase/phospholipase RssA